MLSTHKRVQYIFWKLFVFFVFDSLSRMIFTFSQKQIAYEIFACKLLSLSFFYCRNGERPSVCFTAQEFNACCFFFKSLKGINLRLCFLGVSLRSHKKEASSSHLQIVMGLSIDVLCCLMHREMHMFAYGSSPVVNIHSKQRHSSPDNFGPSFYPLS